MINKEKKPEAWSWNVVGRMHVLQISHRELAEELGITNRYLAMVLNGHVNPRGAAEKYNAAIDEIERKRHAESQAEQEAV